MVGDEAHHTTWTRAALKRDDGAFYAFNDGDNEDEC